jgi:hypothetical protein
MEDNLEHMVKMNWYSSAGTMGQSRGGMYSREKHIYFDKKGQSRTT